MTRETSIVPSDFAAVFGKLPWGTHFCQFYATKEDLVEVLVPYFAYGLRNNEFCMWVTSPPLEVEEAKQALRKAVPELDEYIHKGQIEFLSYADWYLSSGSFDSKKVLSSWIRKVAAALDQGLEGLRLAGNTFWLEKNSWRDFAEYEEAVNDVFSKHKIIAVCTYSLDKCTVNEVVDVVKNHKFTLIKRSGKWEVIESSEAKRIQSELLSNEKKFSALYSWMVEGVAFHEVVYDSSGDAVDYIITDVNPSYERMTGFRKKDLVGKRASEVYGTREAPYLNVYAKVASSGKPEVFETYFPSLKRHLVISAFSPSKGKFATVFHDVTPYRQAQEALRSAASFAEQSPIPILRVARDGKLLYANKPGSDLMRLWMHESKQSVPEYVLQQVARALGTCQVIQFEMECPPTIYSFVVVPVVQFEYANMYGMEITERKRVEQALSQAKLDWERTFDCIPDLIAILDPQHRIIRANRAMANRLGLTPEQCIGLKCFKLVHGTDQPPTFCPHLQTLADKQRHTVEVCESRLEGSFLVSTTPLKDEQGNIVGSVHVARDVSEIKKVENQVRQLSEFQRRVLESIKDELMVLDVNSLTIMAANKALLQKYGVNEADALGKPCYLITHGKTSPCSQSDHPCPLTTMLKTGQPVTVEHIHYSKEGNPHYMEISVSPVKDDMGNTVQAVHLATDVTERKRLEQALRSSEADLKRAQKVANAGSWRLDLQHDRLFWSDEAYRIFGVSTGTPLTYETFLSFVHPDDRKYVDQCWKEALRGKPYDVEHRIIVNGAVRWVREKAELEFDDNGVLRGGFGVVQDITELKNMQQELFETLRESQLRQAEISALLKAARAIMENREFRFSAKKVFDSCKELLGATGGYVALLSDDGKDNVVLFLESGGLPCNVDPSLPMPIRGLRAEAYCTGKVVVENDFQNSRWATFLPDGHMKLQNVLFSPLTVNGRTVGIIGLANKLGGFTERDAQMAFAFGELASIALINSRAMDALEENAERLKAQSEHLEELVQERTKQLKDAERLAAIGQVAGMVGHDIRNPLQSIIGNVYLAKTDLASLQNSELKESLQESLEAIEKQSEYINKIILDLQDFAKPLSPCIEETSLPQLIEDLLSKDALPTNIEADVEVETGTEKIVADSAYMKRILGNLISNAVQAMPHGGKLVVRAHHEKDDVVITIKDTGVGIPEDVKPKLFQPLFTTKSKGQGFGLAVVKRLVEALNGDVTFESHYGMGTEFRIRLPQPKRKHAKPTQ